MKHKINKNSILVIQSSIMTLSFLFAGCSNSDHTQSESTFDTYITSETTTTESITTTSTETEQSETTIDYGLNWDEYNMEAFSNYLSKKYDTSLGAYLASFGYTEDLNRFLTDYVNSLKSTNYDSVPFSAVNYFYRYRIVNYLGNHEYDDFENFKLFYLNDDTMYDSTFNNQLILSYLLENNIEFGKRVDVSYFDVLAGERIKKFELEKYIKTYLFTEFGNDSNRNYNELEIQIAMVSYNNHIQQLVDDQRIKTDELTDSPETLQIINGHLRQFYGDNAPQIGEVITREQYIAIFGEEPIDLSYIPGAIVD